MNRSTSSRVASIFGLSCLSLLGVLVACSSSSSTNATNVDAGEGGSGTGTLSCQDYCTTLMANCSGPNQQFSEMDRCLNSCKAYPVGAAADTSGNTLGCRTYHAGAAKMDPATHCPHAGPGGAGVCGANCDGFCQIAQMYCTAANMAAVYASAAECKSTCAMFPDTAKFNVTDMALQEQKQVACLLYHVQEASTAPADHCLGDIVKDDAGDLSSTCNK